MVPDPADGPAIADRLFGRYGGVVVAGLGFAITRFFVAEAVTISGGTLPVAATIGSLVVGLALTVAGVALAVGAFAPSYVADVSRGCLVGTGAMTAVLVVTVAATGMGMVGEAFGTQLLIANVLLGGAIGGMVNGHRKASLRGRQETIMRGANRARFINRLLRHEVLNAAAIIDGHAELLRNEDGDRSRSVDAIRRGAARIESTIDGVGTIAEDRDEDAVPVPDAIRSTLERFERRNGAEAVDADTDVEADADPAIEAGTDVAIEADTDVDSHRCPDGVDGGGRGLNADDGGTGVDPVGAGSLSVAADDRLPVVFERVIEHAVDVRDAERVRFETTVERHTVIVAIIDDGTPLPDAQRDVLERGSFPEYDDPTSGFALQAASLLVGEYGGEIRVDDANGEGTRVAIRLPRASADAAVATVGVPYPDLARAIVAGVAAGVVMGGIYWLTSGVLPVIGALYGVGSASIGWITHLFHSAVFALLFVAGASTSTLRDRVDGGLRAAAAGLGWGVMLWFGAAGLLMPLWLRAVGVTVPLPNLPVIGLVAHAVWGTTVGAGYVALGGRFD